MKLFPILAAIAVCALIYVFIFEHDSLVGNAPSDQSEVTQPVETAAEEAARETAPIGVVAIRSTARTIDSAVVLRGQTEAFREVSLRAETSGQVISEPLRKGTFVEAGALMCQLDPGTRGSTLAEAQARLAEAISRVPEAEARVPEAEARVEEARARVEEANARLEEAQINVNAATRLSEGGFASETRVASTQAAVRGAEAAVVSAAAGLKSAQSNLESAASGIETAKAGVQSARATVASAEKEIERLTITAPFAGVLETDTAELGSLLQPGDLCATVMQLDPITIAGFVPEQQVSRIELGAEALARLVDGVDVVGEVNFLSRSADMQTRTFLVEMHVPNPDLTVRDGQTAEIVISADGAQAHLLPQSALTLDNSGALGVRVIEEGNITAFRAVTLLRDTPTGVWVTGLEEAAQVIIIGQDFVEAGVRVEPSYQDVSQ